MLTRVRQLVYTAALASGAGAVAAGDMMLDLKAGHLMGTSPRAQFIAQSIGSGLSVFFAVGAYKLFTTVYQVITPAVPVTLALPRSLQCAVPCCAGARA